MENGIITPPDEIEDHRPDPHQKLTRGQPESGEVPKRTNGQCLFAVPSSSMLCPRFDVSLCRTLLERGGFQIASEDFEIPLEKALDSPSVRRYLFFSSSIFKLFIAPVMYVAVWGGIYSTLHLYLRPDFRMFWLLCISVSLVSVVITSAVLLILSHSNKQIKMNTDVRLVQVNERLNRYGFLVGIDDSIRRCTGSLQLLCVFWDLSPCLDRLTETLEGMAFIRGELQSKLQKRMSHLLLATEVPALDLRVGSEREECTDEERPLLVESHGRGCGTSTNRREGAELVKTYSLVPDHKLSMQATAYRLLLTYSAAYVKLMVSERLPCSPLSAQRPLHVQRPHCNMASICLCQYVQRIILE